MYVGVSHVLPHTQSCATSSPVYPPAPFHSEPQQWPDSMWSSGAALRQAGQYIRTAQQPFVVSLMCCPLCKCVAGWGLQHGGACRAAVMPCLCCTYPPAAKTCSRLLGRCVAVVCSCVALSCCCTAAADLTCTCWLLSGAPSHKFAQAESWALHLDRVGGHCQALLLLTCPALAALQAIQEFSGHLCTNRERPGCQASQRCARLSPYPSEGDGCSQQWQKGQAQQQPQPLAAQLAQPAAQLRVWSFAVPPVHLGSWVHQ